MSMDTITNVEEEVKVQKMCFGFYMFTEKFGYTNYIY